MADNIFDEFVDSYTIGLSPYAVSMNFSRSGAKPTAPGSVPISTDVGTIRMSLEHFKIMAFLMKRQVDEVEQNLGISISLPMQLLNQLRVSPEDWAKFWQRQ